MLPELILQRTLINGIQAVRKDPRIVEYLFRNLGQSQVQAVKDFIGKTPIDFAINYPRDNSLKVPAMVLLLKNENEESTFLGDVMGVTGQADTPDYESSYDIDEDGLVLGGYRATSMAGLAPLLTGTMRVASAGEDFVIIHEDDRAEITPLLKNSGIDAVEFEVVRGAGRGQTFNVLRISPSRIDIDGEFDVQLDLTSVVVLRDASPPPAVDGEPSRVYNRQDRFLRKGAQFDTQYQLLVLGSSQEEVIYLYSIIKAVLYLSRVYLEGQGIQTLKISGTDFAPKTEYLPDIVYQRSMILQFTYPFGVLEEMDVVGTIQVELQSGGPHGDHICTTIITLEP